MNSQKRLATLETAARNQLPPDGGSLTAAWNRLGSEAERQVWLRGLNDDELLALCEDDSCCNGTPLAGLDWDKLTEDELELIATSTESEIAEWADRQRAERPHYFTKSNQ